MNTQYLKKIFLVLFLDLCAYSAIMPLLPILFLDSAFFLHGMAQAQKVIWLGVLYAIYPLFQMLCAPFWARHADKLGRKAMLQLSFVGNFLGYLLSGIGIYQDSLAYLLIGNALAGCLGVNLATINALISDFTEGARRIKYFGFVNLVLGMAFAIGPYVSSCLVVKVPHVETVVFVMFIIAALLAILNLVLVSTHKMPALEVGFPKEASFNFKELRKETFYPLLLIFLTTFGWYMFIKTFQIFLSQSEQYRPAEVLKLVAFYGISTVLAQGVFVSGLYKKSTLFISLLGLAVAMALFAMDPGLTALYFLILAITFFQSMIMPNLMALFSKNHSPKIHGQMMSAHLGIVSCAKILAPIISGIMMAFSPILSLGISAAIIGLAACMSPLLFKKEVSLEV